MVAFHGKQGVKDFYLNRVREHRTMDQLRQSFGYWRKDSTNTFRGCAVGCTLHSSNHGAYETELGIPRILARLEDGIFEALPADKAQSWPEDFLDSAQPGADLSLVWPQFAAWLMLDDKWGVINFAETDCSKNAVRKVGDLYRCQVAGDMVRVKKFADAAYAAAADAAYAAAAADAAVAAYFAASYAAAAAAAYAAKAAYKRKYLETCQMARLAQADKLLELMAAAPVAVAA